MATPGAWETINKSRLGTDRSLAACPDSSIQMIRLERLHFYMAVGCAPQNLQTALAATGTKSLMKFKSYAVDALPNLRIGALKNLDLGSLDVDFEQVDLLDSTFFDRSL